MHEPPPASRPSAPRDAARDDHAWLVVGTVVLAVLSFVAAVGLGRALAATGVLQDWNILFDADPVVYLKNFSTGKTIGDWGGRSFVHPNLTNFVYPVVRTISELLLRLPLDLGSAQEVRESVGMLVSPVVAVVRVPILVLLLRVLGLSTGWTLTLAAMDTVSFSTRLFASIPESYLLTGTMIILTFWLCARDLRRSKPPSLMLWGTVLYLLFGITSLNVVAGTLLMGIALWRHHRPRRALILTYAVASGAFGLNALTYEASRLVYPQAPSFNPMSTEHLADSWNPSPSRLGHFATSLADAYFPPLPRARRHYEPDNVRDYTLTLERPKGWIPVPGPRTLVFVAMLVVAVAGIRWIPPELSPLHWGALGIIACGALLHMFLGKELILYTQMWKIPVIVLLTTLPSAPQRLRRVLAFGVPLLVLAMAVNNAADLREVVRLVQPT